jgi:hypothetical protein
MKKFFFTLMLIGAAILNSYESKAQDLCNNDCQFGPMKLFTHTICEAHDGPDTYPAAFVLIYYQDVTCNGVTTVKLHNLVFIDDRNYYGPPYLNFQDACLISPASYSNAQIMQALSNAISAALVSLNITTDIEVLFKGSCTSRTNITFPTRGFVLQPRDSGAADTVWISQMANLAQFVPCNEQCCKITYRMEIREAEEGYTFIVFVPHSIEGNEAECQNSLNPDYNTYEEKLKLTVMLPDGGTEEVEAVANSQEQCQMLCDRMSAPGPFDANFTTDVREIAGQKIPLALSANPTLFSSYIRFSGSQPISRIMVYDISGNLVMEKPRLNNNELNTSSLKNGIYFIQAYFPGEVVKTIKVMKQ